MQFEDSIKDFNGEKIFCRHLKPTNGKDPKCLVFICHGFAEHIGRYDQIFELFNNQDMYVFGHDHVGHGRSSGYRAWIEDYNVFNIAVKMHIEETAARFPGKKVFIYGHSMGGLISAKLLVNYPDLPVNGFILEGPFFGTPPVIPPWQASIATFLGRRRLGRMLPAAKVDPSQISHNPNVVKSYIEDPLVYHGFIVMRFSSTSLDAKDEVFSNAKKLQLPMLITHGDQDQMSPVSASKSFYEEISSQDKTFKAFEGGYHVLRNETFNGIGESFTKLVVEWINARC